MLEKKGIEKNRVSGPKGSTGRGYGQLAQPVALVWSRTDRGPVEATVTCQVLNAPTASELVDPYLDRSRLPFAVFGCRA